MASKFNPYAAPTAEVADISGADSAAEAIRREHIKHESSIKSVGSLYYLGGVAFSLALLTALIAVGQTSGKDAFVTGYLAGRLLFAGAFAVISFMVGSGLRNLKPSIRKPAIALSALGLLAFPVGTLLNVYILYLLLSEKGRRIFDTDYPDIVAATPDIKNRTSPLVWIALALLILVAVLIIVLASANFGR